MLAFISSNKWFRAAYGERLREHITESCHVVSITDFGELPVFKTAATFPMIFVSQKSQKGRSGPSHPTTFTQVKDLGEPYPDVLALIRQRGNELPATAIIGSNWMLTDSASADLFERMKDNATPLGPIVKGRILYGLKTGFNRAFVLDAQTRRDLVRADPKSSEIIHPLAVGDDVRIPMMSISHSDLMPIRTERSDAGLY